MTVMGRLLTQILQRSARPSVTLPTYLPEAFPCCNEDFFSLRREQRTRRKPGQTTYLVPCAPSVTMCQTEHAARLQRVIMARAERCKSNTMQIGSPRIYSVPFPGQGWMVVAVGGQLILPLPAYLPLLVTGTSRDWVI